MTAIFFDLDGTLIDPKAGITRSIQYALHKLGLPCPPVDELTWCIGPPLLGSLKKLLGRDDLAETALSLYRERFAEIGIFEFTTYPGIEDALSAFAQRGKPLFVATSKPHVYARRIVDQLEMAPYLDRVFGSELDGVRTDKTELLAYALETTRVVASRAMMIGDRGHDMIGARRNAMTAIGVLYGYGSEDELIEAGAQRICATPQDLINFAAHRAPAG
jgi:phosphoglycolate phosphatase